MPEPSIYPIEYLHFECAGCKTEWTLYVAPPIRNIDDFKAYMDAGKMGPCPKACGALTCSVRFRLKGKAS